MIARLLLVILTLFPLPSFAVNAIHTVLVQWTQQVETKYGAAGALAQANKACTLANTAYTVSEVAITMTCVGLNKSPVVEQTGGVVNTITSFRTNATTIAAIASLHADIAVLLTMDTGGGYVGTGRLWTVNGVTDAHAVVKVSAIGQYTFTHEVGHLQGLSHNIQNKNQTPAYSTGYGYRLCVDTLNQAFRDIMSYPCNSPSRTSTPTDSATATGPRKNFFGNPAKTITINGVAYPTGTTAYNPALALNNNAVAVSHYRD